VRASDGNPIQFKTISLPIQSLITATLPCLYAMRAMNTVLNITYNVDSIDEQYSPFFIYTGRNKSIGLDRLYIMPDKLI
jgi:hypothetical protein